MALSCATCSRRIEDMAEVERQYGEVHDGQTEAYMHFKPDVSDPTGYRGYYYPMDHLAAPELAHPA
jgi:hypothetical protein